MFELEIDFTFEGTDCFDSWTLEEMPTIELARELLADSYGPTAKLDWIKVQKWIDKDQDWEEIELNWKG